MEVVVKYVWSANEHLDLEAAKDIFSKVDEKVGELAVTVFEQIEEQGRAKGVVEGEAKGKASMLVRMLKLRFGQLPPEAIQRIEAGTEEELEKWASRYLATDSIEQLLAD